MSDKVVPKSLHTVTVLVVMARATYKASQFTTTTGHTASLISIKEAVESSLSALGYPINADFYGLADQAIKKLLKVTK